MLSEFTDIRRSIFRIVIIIGCVALFGFTLFQFRKIIEGPAIAAINVEDGQIVYSDTYMLEAEIHNAAFIYLNGRQVYTNKESVLREQLILFEGYNLIELRVNDKFNRQQVRTYRLVYLPDSSSTL